MRPFCQQVSRRDYNNLWQINVTCDACFRPQASIIGRHYIVLYTVLDPLVEAARFEPLEEWVLVVDFNEFDHADVGGSFHLLLLTTTTLECMNYHVFVPSNTKQ